MLSILGTHPLETAFFLIVLFLILFNLDKIFPHKDLTDYDNIKLVAKMNGCKPVDVFIIAYNAYGPHSFVSDKGRDDIKCAQYDFLERKKAFRYQHIPWMKAFMDENFSSWEEQKEKEKKRKG